MLPSQQPANVSEPQALVGVELVVVELVELVVELLVVVVVVELDVVEPEVLELESVEPAPVELPDSVAPVEVELEPLDTDDEPSEAVDPPWVEPVAEPSEVLWESESVSVVDAVPSDVELVRLPLVEPPPAPLPLSEPLPSVPAPGSTHTIDRHVSPGSQAPPLVQGQPSVPTTQASEPEVVAVSSPNPPGSLQPASRQTANGRAKPVRSAPPSIEVTLSPEASQGDGTGRHGLLAIARPTGCSPTGCRCTHCTHRQSSGRLRVTR